MQKVTNICKTIEEMQTVIQIFNSQQTRFSLLLFSALEIETIADWHTQLHHMIHIARILKVALQRVLLPPEHHAMRGKAGSSSRFDEGWVVLGNRRGEG